MQLDPELAEDINKMVAALQAQKITGPYRLYTREYYYDVDEKGEVTRHEYPPNREDVFL